MTKSARNIKILLKLLDIDGLTVSQSVRHSSAKEALLAAAVKYVRKRGGVFQYERRVPEKVKREPAHYAVHFGSRPLFRVSLKTKNEAQMHIACVAVHMEFEKKVASAGGGLPMGVPHAQTVVAPMLQTVTQVELDSIADRYRRVTVDPFERAFIKADASAQDAEEYERMLYDMELHAEQDGKTLSARGGTGKIENESPADIAAWVVDRDGLDAPAGSKAFGAVVGAVRSGIHQGREEIQNLIEGRSVPRLGSRQERSLPIVQTLREAVDEYLAHRKLPVPTETEVMSSLRLFEQLVGNKRLDGLSRRDFQMFTEHLAKQTVGGRSAGSISRPVSGATVKKRVGLLRSVINHAIDKDQFAGPNPASGIRVEAYISKPNKAIMPDKRRMTVEEMNLVFQHPWFTGCASKTNTHVPGQYRLTGSEYWVPVLAALTGCRASELGGLMLSEVMLDGACPHLLIRDNKYRRTKGGYARKVPVLDELMSVGFAAYVDAVRKSGAERLFPDWLPPKGKNSERNDDKAWSNGKIIRAFNRTVVPHMLDGRLAPGARQEVTFHSLRGAFKAMLGSAEYKLHPNTINEVLGHSKSELDTRYVGEVPIEETYPAVRGCRFKGLIIPSPCFAAIQGATAVKGR